MEVGFSLGGNQGDRVKVLCDALDRLHAADGLTIDKVSRFYETPPWGDLDQPAFINLCAIGTTSLTPDALLSLTQKTERDLGRVKTRHWGPRLIDIDILYFGDINVEDEALTIPHRHILQRAFVLVPLAEIASDLMIRNTPINQAISDLATDAEEISVLGHATWAAKA